ncbi:MAG: ExbD/TolR family protein [Isosphaeraceae bacterium]
MHYGYAGADEQPYINMTPMVDVILCLLVFFLAATKLYDWDQAELPVQVPEVGSARPATEPPDDLQVAILSPGLVNVRGQTYDLKKLTELLTDSRTRYEDQGVLIQGDARLTYQDVADVLAVCDVARIKSVRLAVKPAVQAGSGGPSR